MEVLEVFWKVNTESALLRFMCKARSLSRQKIAQEVQCFVYFFQPLFKVSAQEKSLNRLTDKEIDKIKKDRPGGYSETEVLLS